MTAARKPALTGLDLIASRMPENGGEGSLEHALIMMLRKLPGILRQHNSDSRKAHRGFPDWLLAGPGGMLVWELKRESESPTAEQQQWLDAFAAAGIPSGCRRPSDLLSGRMGRELAQIAGLVKSPRQARTLGKFSDCTGHPCICYTEATE